VSEEPASDDHASPPPLPGVAGFLALGTTIASCVAVGVIGGIAADNAWRLAPWGLFVGLALGVTAAVMSVMKLVQRWL
jgi:F0F1-type ATP synthase assembly protein I